MIEQQLDQEREAREVQHRANQRFFYMVLGGLILAVFTGLFNMSLHYATLNTIRATVAPLVQPATPALPMPHQR